MSYSVKQVIVVRKDLSMRKGKIAAQVAHASMKILLDLMSKTERIETIDCEPKPLSFTVVTRKFEIGKGLPLDMWLQGSFAKIVVYCNSEEELLQLSFKAMEAEIAHALIVDSGYTEFKGVPTKTCLALGPHDSEELNKITGHLKLL